MAILAKLMDFYLAAGKTTILPVCLTKRGNAPCKQTKLAFEIEDGQNKRFSKKILLAAGKSHLFFHNNSETKQSYFFGKLDNFRISVFSHEKRLITADKMFFKLRVSSVVFIYTIANGFPYAFKAVMTLRYTILGTFAGKRLTDWFHLKSISAFLVLYTQILQHDKIAAEGGT